MKGASTPVHQVQDTRFDASHSRVFLTSRNYRGPRLLRNIRGHPNATPSQSASIDAEPTMGNMVEDDIMAPPMSSDDEDEALLEDTLSRSDSPTRAKRKSDDAHEVAPANKRAKKQTKPSRASKRNMQESAPVSESILDDKPPQSSANTLALPDFLSQSSQSKKRQRAKFGKTKSYVSSSSQGASLDVPDDIPLTPRKAQPTSLVILDGTPKSRKRTPSKRLKEMKIPSSAKKTKVIAPSFSIPEDISLVASSSVSTELSKLHDGEVLLDTSNRRRSASTSSLSSVDSMASLELEQQQKDELANGALSREPVPVGCIRCPLCRNIVNPTKYTEFPDPTQASLRNQQKFCHQHRSDDAQSLWNKKGYPEINWKALEKKRMSKHIPHLRQILYRKTPSFYLDSLESKLTEAKGNQSKIRRYLANDIVEVVKPGYYGPKGAKVMGNKITTEMSNHLKRSLKADTTVRAVGVSGYISAVLLPELLQQIVMEDMSVDDADEVRSIIGESTEAGMLLWPDDDYVVPEDDGV